MELYLSDRINRHPRIQEVFQHLQSAITSEDPTTGQAIDYRLEEMNAMAQNLLPPGVPTRAVWRLLYRYIRLLRM